MTNAQANPQFPGLSLPAVSIRSSLKVGVLNFIASLALR